MEVLQVGDRAVYRMQSPGAIDTTADASTPPPSAHSATAESIQSTPQSQTKPPLSETTNTAANRSQTETPKKSKEREAAGEDVDMLSSPLSTIDGSTTPAPEGDDGGDSKEKKRKRSSKLSADEIAAREEQRRKKAEEVEKRKAAKDAEKEEKRKMREEDRRKKEEEKKAKDEEKRKKEEERKKKEEERKKKEEEKKRKEEEKEEERKKKEEEKKKREEEKEERKRKEEEEKRKKEEKQLRLSSFFKKPRSPSKPSASSSPSTTTTTATAAASADPAINPDSISQTTPATAEETKSDYEQTFLPFFVKSWATLYPATKFAFSEPALKDIRQRLDSAFASTSSSDLTIPEKAATPPNFAELLQLPSRRPAKRGIRPERTTKEVVTLFGALDGPITTSVSSLSEDEVREMLNSLPRKFLRFCEDLRPPLSTTFTKSRKVPRNNPFFRDERINYDYDSELEWNEEEDGEPGEDLDMPDSDDEEDTLIDEEMKDFLVADNDEEVGGENASTSRRRILAPLVPFYKGVCFTDLETGKNEVFDETGMGIATIQPNITLPIDPFKDYWTIQKEEKKAEKKAEKKVEKKAEKRAEKKAEKAEKKADKKVNKKSEKKADKKSDKKESATSGGVQKLLFVEKKSPAATVGQKLLSTDPIVLD
ncbi:chromatin assembly factor 1 subunit A-domain-containing protein [Myxozyma melibiosi]|uniref:Chromatin assembly factor 1 subunit A-domain-containing protein n=1 Tax=Myxozyma melibiosi TaxID=54550 RepID=A0ABR1F8Z8_9ASCO